MVIIDRTEELRNCTFVKTILMMLVVIYHSVVFWGGNWFVLKPLSNSMSLRLFASWLNSFHIYAFTLVSGYLFYYLRHERGKYNRYGEFLLNKAKRLLVPYVFVSIVWVIPINTAFYSQSFLEYVKNFLFAVSPRQLWFLVMLFMVFVIFWPLSNYLKEHNFVGIIAMLILWCIGYVGTTFTPNYFQIYTALRYILFFYVGFKLRQNGTSFVMKIPTITWVIADIVLFALNTYLQKFDFLIIRLVAVGVSLSLNIVGAIMAFVVISKIANRVKWENNKRFGILSKTSMPIYLFH